MLATKPKVNISRARWKKIKKINLPSGSTSFAIFMDSDVARSVLAPVTARISEFGFCMYFKINVLIWISMSNGWSPTAIYQIKQIINVWNAETYKVENICFLKKNTLKTDMVEILVG